MCYEFLGRAGRRRLLMTKKRRRRKPEQIVKLLQEGDAMLAAGKSAAEIYQKLEISEATWIRWKKQFGGMKSDEAKRRHVLAEANTLPNR